MPRRSANARTGTTNIMEANKAMKKASRPAAMQPHFIRRAGSARARVAGSSGDAYGFRVPAHTSRFKVKDGCPRSEERRVGKECRARWSADDDADTGVGRSAEE